MYVYFMYSIIYVCNMHMWSFPDGSVIKIPLPVQEISGLGRSPGEGNGNPLQYSCLENPMDRGATGGLQSWSHKVSDIIE